MRIKRENKRREECVVMFGVNGVPSLWWPGEAWV